MSRRCCTGPSKISTHVANPMQHAQTAQLLIPRHTDTEHQVVHSEAYCTSQTRTQDALSFCSQVPRARTRTQQVLGRFAHEVFGPLRTRTYTSNSCMIFFAASDTDLHVLSRQAVMSRTYSYSLHGTPSRATSSQLSIHLPERLRAQSSHTRKSHAERERERESLVAYCPNELLSQRSGRVKHAHAYQARNLLHTGLYVSELNLPICGSHTHSKRLGAYCPKT